MIKNATFEIGWIMTLPGFKEVPNPVYDTVPPEVDEHRGTGSRLIQAFWVQQRVMLIEYRALLSDGFDLLEPKDGQMIHLRDNDIGWMIDRLVHDVWPAWIAQANINCAHPLYLEACPPSSYVVRGEFPNNRPWLIRIDGDIQYTVAGVAFS